MESFILPFLLLLFSLALSNSLQGLSDDDANKICNNIKNYYNKLNQQVVKFCQFLNDTETFYYDVRNEGDVPLTWTAANETCNLFHNNSELTFLQTLLQNQSEHYWLNFRLAAVEESAGNNFFDVLRNHEWIWEDGTPLLADHWIDGAVCFDYLIPGCLSFYTEEGKFIIESCSDENFALCQYYVPDDFTLPPSPTTISPITTQFGTTSVDLSTSASSVLTTKWQTTTLPIAIPFETSTINLSLSTYSYLITQQSTTTRSVPTTQLETSSQPNATSVGTSSINLFTNFHSSSAVEETEHSSQHVTHSVTTMQSTSTTRSTTSSNKKQIIIILVITVLILVVAIGALIFRHLKRLRRANSNLTKVVTKLASSYYHTYDELTYPTYEEISSTKAFAMSGTSVYSFITSVQSQYTNDNTVSSVAAQTEETYMAYQSIPVEADLIGLNAD